MLQSNETDDFEILTERTILEISSTDDQETLLVNNLNEKTMSYVLPAVITAVVMAMAIGWYCYAQRQKRNQKSQAASVSCTKSSREESSSLFKLV